MTRKEFNTKFTDNSTFSVAAITGLMIFLLVTFAADAAELPFTITDRQYNNQEIPYQLEFDYDYDSNYFTIASVEVNEIDQDEVYLDLINNKNLGQVIATANQLIAFGQKVWDLVKANKPIVNMSMSKQIAVLPAVEKPRVAFEMMTNWEAPKTKLYEVTFKNLYGSNVVKFIYAVSFEYGGKYNGKGNYLNAVRIAADTASISWGYEFNAITEVVSVVNRGSQDDPEAAVTFKLNYQVKTVFKEINSEESFYITGSGDLRKVY